MARARRQQLIRERVVAGHTHRSFALTLTLNPGSRERCGDRSLVCWWCSGGRGHRAQPAGVRPPHPQGRAVRPPGRRRRLHGAVHRCLETQTIPSFSVARSPKGQHAPAMEAHPSASINSSKIRPGLHYPRLPARALEMTNPILVGNHGGATVACGSFSAAAWAVPAADQGGG